MIKPRYAVTVTISKEESETLARLQEKDWGSSEIFRLGLKTAEKIQQKEENDE